MADSSKTLNIQLKLQNQQLTEELNKIKAQFSAMGAHGVSQTQAVSGAIRALDFNPSIRSAEKFLVMLPGVGQALVAAFPLIGMLAFADMAGKMIGKLNDIRKELEASANAPSAFATAMEPVHISLDQEHLKLVKIKDELDNQLATLNHRPTNSVKIAIDDIASSTISMGEQFQSTFKKIQEAAVQTKLVLDGLAYVWNHNLKGESTGEDSNNRLTTIQSEIQKRNAATADAMANAKSPADRLAAQRKGQDDMLAYLQGEKDILTKAQSVLKTYTEGTQQVTNYDGSTSTRKYVANDPSKNTRDIAINDQTLNALTSSINDLKLGKQIASEQLAVAGKHDSASALKAQETPFTQVMQRLQDELKMASAESNRFAQAAAKAENIITETNRRNASEGRAPLSDEQEQQIKSAEHSLAQAEAIRVIKDSEVKTQEEAAKKLAESNKKYAEAMTKAAEDASKLAENLDREAEEQRERIGKATLEIDRQISDNLWAAAHPFVTTLEKLHHAMEDEIAKSNESIAEKMKGAPQSAINSEQKKSTDAITGKYNTDIQSMTSVTAGLQNAWSQISDQINDVGHQVTSIATGAFKGLEDQMTSMIVTGKANWASLFQSLASELTKLAMNMALSKLMKLVGGMGGGDIPDGASTGQGLLGAMDAGGGMAVGGSVDPSQYYTVGEHGTEIFSPGTSGTIIPHEALGGQTSVNITNHIDARGAHNSAEVEMAVHRGIQQHRAQFLSDAANMQREARARSVRGRA